MQRSTFQPEDLRVILGIVDRAERSKCAICWDALNVLIEFNLKQTVNQLPSKALIEKQIFGIDGEW